MSGVLVGASIIVLCCTSLSTECEREGDCRVALSARQPWSFGIRESTAERSRKQRLVVIGLSIMWNRKLVGPYAVGKGMKLGVDPAWGVILGCEGSGTMVGMVTSSA